MSGHSLPVRTAGGIQCYTLHMIISDSGPVRLDILASDVHIYLTGPRFFSSPSRLFVTGRSANTLLFLACQIFALDPVSGVLNLDIIIRCEKILSSLSSHEILERYAIDAKRVCILATGAMSIRVMMEVFLWITCYIHAEGIQGGFLVAYDHCYGAIWWPRSRRTGLCSEWRSVSSFSSCSRRYILSGRMQDVA